jgi:N6-L-threonylcarbamoyladenine synthase
MTEARSRVLGIETSCDDTSAAVLEDGRTLRSLVIAAQDVHRLYGGVVPELASRAHLELLPRTVAAALAEAGVSAAELSAVAVTHVPGLVGSLVVGVAFAKAYAYALGIPVVGVNHIEAHLHATALEHGPDPLPAVCLVVSGGHTELVLVEGFQRYRWLGSTRDDAAGEAYDKVAKLLGLGFPGGPILDALALRGNPNAIPLPRPMRESDDFDFSFSGLKTAVALHVERHRDAVRDAAFQADVAASFQAAVVDVLAEKSLRALDRSQARALRLGGGVACNRSLRRTLAEACAARGVAFQVPSPRLCADNAAMVALVGSWCFERGQTSDASLDAAASLDESGLPLLS